MPHVSRGYYKLEKAIKEFNIDPKNIGGGAVCADLGASTGGFVECLLDSGASKVYAIETGYGILDWKLRNDKRVVVMEKTNALSTVLPEPVDIVTIDSSWTRQSNIIPIAMSMLKKGGIIISLVKPHYEAKPAQLTKGKLDEKYIQEVLDNTVKEVVDKLGDNIKLIGITESPITGLKGKNREYLTYYKKMV